MIHYKNGWFSTPYLDLLVTNIILDVSLKKNLDTQQFKGTFVKKATSRSGGCLVGQDLLLMHYYSIFFKEGDEARRAKIRSPGAATS